MAPWSNGGCWCASPRSARDALTCRRSMASVRGDARLPLLALPCRRKLAPAGRPADAHRPITRTPIRLRAFNATIKTASARCLPNHGGYTSTCLTLRGSRSLRRDACGCRERVARASAQTDAEGVGQPMRLVLDVPQGNIYRAQGVFLMESSCMLW